MTFSGAQLPGECSVPGGRLRGKWRSIRHHSDATGGQERWMAQRRNHWADHQQLAVDRWWCLDWDCLDCLDCLDDWTHCCLAKIGPKTPEDLKDMSEKKIEIVIHKLHKLRIHDGVCPKWVMSCAGTNSGVQPHFQGTAVFMSFAQSRSGRSGCTSFCLTGFRRSSPIFQSLLKSFSNDFECISCWPKPNKTSQ